MNDSLPALIPPPPPPDRTPAGDFDYGPPEPAGGGGSAFSIGRYLFFLRKYWWLPLLTLVLGAGAGIAYVVYKPPTYISRGRLWETGKVRMPEGSLVADDPATAIGTQTELLRSSELHQLTLESLRSSSTNAVPRGPDGQPLKVKVFVAQVPRTAMFEVTASSSDPRYTQVYLNTLMERYLDYKRNQRKLVVGGTMASISAQVMRLENNLKEAEEDLNKFQRTNNMAILREEGAVAGGYLTRLKTQLSDLRLEQQLLEAGAKPGPDGTNAAMELSEALRSLGPGTAGGGVDRTAVLKEIELLKMQRQKLAEYLLPKHPKLAKVDADLERAQKMVELMRTQNQQQLSAMRQSIQMRMTNVLEFVKEWEVKVVEANAKIGEAERLKLNVTRIQSLYDRLAMMAQNMDINRSLDQETLSILEPAGAAVSSSKDDQAILAMSVVAGLMAGLGLVFLIQLVDDRFTSLAEVNDKLGQAVVGQLPEVAPPRRKERVPLLENDDTRHAYAESYRSLRSALLFMPSRQQRPQVMVVTSAQPNEGKSTVTANLARTLAQGGTRVLLIDADLRRGVLHELLGLKSEPGLADLLSESDTFESYIQKHPSGNLFFLPRGNASRRAGELFLSPMFDESLARMRQQFDYVLIDTCPVFAADDATTLAPKSDGVILVVRNSFSRARIVRQALELLYQRRVRVLGLVYNRADSTASSYYYYKYAEYDLPAGKA